MDVNGTASSLFRSQKGVKQGDPISPFLFIMVVEVLSVMIKRTSHMNLILGFKSAADASAIHHLEFVDNLIVFLDDQVEEIQNLKNILLSFELVSGLKVNFKKSAIVAVGNAVNIEANAIIFGCPITTLPMKYLGIPLGSKSKSVEVWDVIIQRFQ
ncbi:uncharacterized protein LOC113315541 [Papaver somniferum]|uniref:uncharacterized protein LOC113315541 n=1 Tax=Papaver somniferum TaxID=3469 RepID=UPI000E6F4EB5|nr:uncharacterized protein LOC113315541 [Papaver somniferum]